ncbi:hypothetical protein [Pseudomaricurvus sp. HS19]|uniref:DUF7931 domain-containing protein n=1 Tax=Pseudomaricurvus sp. HS19 TaxID=2692626 RepID=UPI00136A6EA4|nr:hypothetical protein [Pseudomaricurvus sp. HS19]MYM62211.1 hypothetical protein [Pseudomaricurvus sp. HS19]
MSELRATPSESCDTLTLLQGPATFVHYACENLRAGHREVSIFSTSLNKALYGDEDFCSALSALARGHRLAEIRILVLDTEPLLSGRHPLLRLQQRLSSKVKIRQATLQPEHQQRGYMIVDRSSVLLQHDDGQFDGFCNTEARAEAASLLDEFREMWERQSTEISDLRTFTL